MTMPLTMECEVHFARGRGGRKVLIEGAKPIASSEPGRIARVARWMALAIRCEASIRSGAIGNYAELASLGRVSRARVSQIMNLLNLAPDIQDAILHLPRTVTGRDAKVQPSQADRSKSAPVRHPRRGAYTAHAYGRAIDRAAKLAGVRRGTRTSYGTSWGPKCGRNMGLRPRKTCWAMRGRM